MQRIFTITHAGDKPDSGHLVGLEIQQTDDGFKLVDPPHKELAESKLVNVAGAPLLTFNVEKYHGQNWTIDVDGASATGMHGTWNNKFGIAMENDSWTASGTGTGESGDREKRAASAR